ncbi:hypothetical protein B5C34_04365 [Pacificimonas flava]|uniref:CENP-V/GFA domain-containing protein n=2 Tax=Pacificimonas TaxID=1960290 RepID=A0A219B4P3_9SPHN|nr:MULTISPECIES: DUF6151 family protein [Pacificimonas]MBZ6377548.1 hypothetical protein [Pacificimonas aurantium]OWV32759.1 hypothetical protein B5C34_04365 [Pacificimonas flava]
MSARLNFGCDCGAVKGSVSPAGVADARPYVCHCTDCQAFAHFCGRADEVLDRHAGTQILQLPAWAVRLDQGKDGLSAIHLTDGSLVRWSCRTCRTPLANTLGSPRWSFYSMILSGPSARELSKVARIPRHVFTASGAGDLSSVPTASMLRMGLPIAKWLIRARLSGAPHPLFDRESGEPFAEPRRLRREEREPLYEAAAAYRRTLDPARR